MHCATQPKQINQISHVYKNQIYIEQLKARKPRGSLRRTCPAPSDLVMMARVAHAIHSCHRRGLRDATTKGASTSLI